jgi:hypothetical protein
VCYPAAFSLHCSQLIDIIAPWTALGRLLEDIRPAYKIDIIKLSTTSHLQKDNLFTALWDLLKSMTSKMALGSKLFYRTKQQVILKPE